MANREACEVYIDQEIETGLKEGKTPYSIGKELSTWIAKLFEVKINPDTLRKRAERQQQTELWTNVHKNSETLMDKELTTCEVCGTVHGIRGSCPDCLFTSGRGGKRKGAGRIMLPPHLFPFK